MTHISITRIAAWALLSLVLSCSTRPFGPGHYHPDGNPAQTINFMADGRVEFSHESGGTQVEDFQGYYFIYKDRVIFSAEKYCSPDDATYAWARKGKALKFTILHDGRADRQESLTAAELLAE